MPILLGSVADDFTGATDLANTLVKAGMRTVQLLGVPRAGLSVPDADAVIVALKSRSNPASEAVESSLAALKWLQAAGARQFYFKYCSTFDSTDRGNIGPVADALLDALDADFTVFNPSFPTNKRTVYKGYLFVGDELLSESGMRHHPLTPMTDPSLVRVLQRQTKHKVGLVQYSTVVKGAQAVRAAIGLALVGFSPCCLGFYYRRPSSHAGRSVFGFETRYRWLWNGDGLAGQFCAPGFAQNRTALRLAQSHGTHCSACGQLLGRDAGTSGADEEGA